MFLRFSFLLSAYYSRKWEKNSRKIPFWGCFGRVQNGSKICGSNTPPYDNIFLGVQRGGVFNWNCTVPWNWEDLQAPWELQSIVTILMDELKSNMAPSHDLDPSQCIIVDEDVIAVNCTSSHDDVPEQSMVRDDTDVNSSPMCQHQALAWGMKELKREGTIWEKRGRARHTHNALRRQRKNKERQTTHSVKNRQRNWFLAKSSRQSL